MDYSFGNWIKRRRKALDLTQQELAHRVGCSVASIIKIESDQRRPSRQIAELLAQHLEIPLEQRLSFVKIARQERPVEIFEQLPAAAGNVSQTESRPAKLNLPLSPNPLVGREHELNEVIQQLRQPHCRLLTLTGLGGVGKTRLALEAGHYLQDSFKDGLFFVSLVGVSAPEFILTAIADALRLPFSGPGNPQAQLLSYLQGKEVLLILDNFEHLIHAAELLGGLLQQVPGVKFLVTSREQLLLQSEWVFEVQGLPVPVSSQEIMLETSSAARLFLQRAQQSRYGFELNDEENHAVARICQLVEGLPLAIELAAAWVRTLTLEEIVQELECGLSLLESTSRDLPNRHRSIHAVLDYSWKLLSPAEQDVWIRLSVFRGGFTRHAAEQVAGATLPLLSALVTKSLVRRTDHNRYDLHELVCEYAAAYLQARKEDRAATLGHHSDYFIDLLVLREQEMISKQQGAVLTELSREVDNLRAAFDWAIHAREHTRLRQVSFTVFYFYEMRNWFLEGEQFFRRAAEELLVQPSHGPGDDTDRMITYYDMLSSQAYFTYRTGGTEEAEILLRRSVAALRSYAEKDVLRFALRYLGLVSLRSGRLDESEALMRESLEMSIQHGQPWETAITNAYLGVILYERGDLSGSQAYFENGLTLGRTLGDTRILSFGLAFWSRTLLLLGQIEKARLLLQESLSQATSVGDRYGIGTSQVLLGVAAQSAGQFGEARELIEQGLRHFKDIGDPINLCRSLAYLGYLDLEGNQVQDAKSHFLEALRIAHEVNATMYVLAALAGLAAVLARGGDHLLALQCASLVLQHPNSSWLTCQRAADIIEELKAHLAQPEVEAAQSWGQARKLEDIIKEILTLGV